MTKQEFLDMLQKEKDDYERELREKRDNELRKQKQTYYLNGEGILVGLYLQKTMAEAYYVEFDFFIGEFKNPKLYPTTYESDYYGRVCVLSKDIDEGDYYMTALIEYELYTPEELKPYFDKAFDEFIMPPLLEGKETVLKIMEYYDDYTLEEKENIIKKLQLDQ